MTRSQIVDNVFFDNKKPIELEFSYVYNKYKENEAIQADNIITNVSDDSNSYIKLNLSLDSEIYNSSTENINLRKINLLSSIDRLNMSEKSYFHMPEFINPNKAYFNIDMDYNDFYDYYNILAELADVNLDSANTSRKICINDDFVNELLIANKKSSFYSSINDDIYENYNQIYEPDAKTKNLKELYTNGLFLGKYEVYNRKNYLRNDRITENLNLQDTNRETLVGFYIVKYKKDSFDKENPYENVCSRFFKVQGSLSLQIINDENIKYGQTYKYFIYPVYSLTIESVLKNGLEDQILVCSYPVITKDIEAIETVRPSPPAGPFVDIDRKKINAIITWEKPYELQNDIKGYQIFKRYNLDEPFVLLKEQRSHTSTDAYTPRQNIQEESIFSTPGSMEYEFIDNTFDPSKVNIYTMCSIDAHGLTSDYSTQVGVVYDALIEKTTHDKISEPGAPLEYPNLFVKRRTIFFDNEDSIISNTPVVSKKHKFSFYFTPDAQTINTTEGTTIDHIQDESSYSLQVFRLNGQKSITINNNEPKIKIKLNT